jgi:O-antigen ligase
MAMASLTAGAADFAHRGALWMAVAIGFSIPISTALDNLLVAALLLLWIAGGRYIDKWAALRANPFVLFPCGLFLLYLAGSLYSMGDAGAVVHALDKALVLLLIPVLIALAPAREIRDRALYAFMAAILLTLVLSFLLWMGTVPEGGEDNIIKGVRQDPVVFKKHITHGTLMAFGAFAFAVLARGAARPAAKALLALVAALAAFNVLFMIRGRSGQFVLIALVLYLVFSWLRWRGLLAAAAAGMAIVGMVYLAPSSSLHERVTATISEIEDWQAGKPAQLRNMRLESWSNSLKIVRDHPLVGVGTGGFAAAYAKQVKGTSMMPIGQPENQYLLTTVQLGVVGLAALLALFVMQWRLASRLATRTDTDLARGLVVAMAIGCLFNSFLLDHTEALFYAWFSGLLFAGLRTPTGRG